MEEDTKQSARGAQSLPHKLPKGRRLASPIVAFSLLFGALVLGSLQLATHRAASVDNRDILKIAYTLGSFPGYCDLNDSGVGTNVTFNGQIILRASKRLNFYCCGFTFDVVMRAAEQRGLLKNKSLDQIRLFQREWYGRTPESLQQQVVVAMEHLEIGHRVAPIDAEPGDFVNYWTGSSGHSAIFLSWVKEGNTVVGLKYRSSQFSTNGVGDQISYFTTCGNSEGVIIPEEFFVARLLTGNAGTRS